MHKIIIPKIEANTDSVILVEWFKAEDDFVQAEEPLFEVETIKTTIVIDAEYSGYLKRILVRENEKVPVLTVVALMGEKDESLADCEIPEGGNQPAKEKKGQKIKATPAARRIAREHSLDLETIYGGERLTQKDVISHIRNTPQGRTVQPKAAELIRHVNGHLDEIQAMGNVEKISLYREYGAHIADDVDLTGTVIIAGSIQIGTGVSIPDALIRCDSISIGAHSKFGKYAKVQCRNATLGAHLYADADLTIGGGGNRDLEANITVGDWCFIGKNVFLNTCREIRIGRETFIAQNSMVLTHSFAQSVLEGFPAVFSPVAIGDFCQIGLNCVIHPGVSIGDRVVLSSCSHCVTDLPEGMLAQGVPARPVKRSNRELTPDQKNEILSNLMKEFVELAESKGSRVAPHPVGYRIGTKDRSYLLSTLAKYERWVRDFDHIILVCLETPEIAGSSQLTVFDIKNKHAANIGNALALELREFLRKRGIRFINLPQNYVYRETL